MNFKNAFILLSDISLFLSAHATAQQIPQKIQNRDQLNSSCTMTE